MAQDLAPAPIQAPMTDNAGVATPIWSEWFRKISGSSDKSSSGYQKLAGGVVVQWGVTGNLNSGSSNPVSFPTAFPSSCLQVIAGVRDNSAVATTTTGQFGTGNYSTTGFNLYNRTSVTLTFNWFAVGF